MGKMPMPHPADEAPAFDLDTMAEAGNYNEWIYATMKPYLGRRILNLGCGTGNLTPLFLRQGRSVLAIDVDAHMIQGHQANVGARPGLELRQAAIQDLTAELAGSFDNVISSNVLEHIPDGIEEEVIRATYELLKPGGASVHWVPAAAWAYGSLDRAYGHFRRYDKTRLAGAFKKAGFRVARCRYWNCTGLLGWWWLGHVLKVQHLSRRATRLYDRWVVPALSRVEPWLWLPSGQSLFIVARKDLKP